VLRGRLQGGPSSRDEIEADAIVWATGAGAPALVAASALARDADGFLTVEETLQSTSHANVFAAGDVATMIDHPRPRSGVYAVRQGPPLAHNLRAAVAGGAMVRHVPQRRALAIITTGGRHAVATRGDWAVAGGWVWRWKDWIDRRFMARYARER
jgi:selenide,water dikinase